MKLTNNKLEQLIVELLQEEQQNDEFKIKINNAPNNVKNTKAKLGMGSNTLGKKSSIEVADMIDALQVKMGQILM